MDSLSPARRRRLLAAVAVSLWHLGAAEGIYASDTAADTPAEQGWELLERDDTRGEAYELWGRLPPGSTWRAFRMVAELDVPPEVAIEAAMDVVADVSRAAPGETRRLLLRTPAVIVNYSRVDLPMAEDRDVTTRLERTSDPETGDLRLVWREANEEGPPLEHGVVRMQRARGSWDFRPLPAGRTRVVFESHAELGGAIPAWLINPLMTGTIKSNIVDLRTAIDRRSRGDVAAGR